ncbi:rRNA maturation RNase YbeY [Spiroplasma endosymbiont of Stenodema calcarata]|uniref:rRNA maturation RNase YbeY n=1 Tax=Spiroplasma endosymbiont of Stenodema calcarata TaxID=3139328 RepID=UPI003CCB15D4
MVIKDDFVIHNATTFDIVPYQADFMAIFQKIKVTLNISEPLELSLIIVDAKEQLELNKQYRQNDYVADVITFALEEENTIDLLQLTGLRSLGDIFICYEKALEQAATYNHSVRREFAFLFTHGMLHILGYDHQTPATEETMFNLQRKVLNDLQIHRIPIE